MRNKFRSKRPPSKPVQTFGQGAGQFMAGQGGSYVSSRNPIQPTKPVYQGFGKNKRPVMGPEGKPLFRKRYSERRASRQQERHIHSENVKKSGVVRDIGVAAMKYAVPAVAATASLPAILQPVLNGGKNEAPEGTNKPPHDEDNNSEGGKYTPGY